MEAERKASDRLGQLRKQHRHLQRLYERQLYDRYFGQMYAGNRCLIEERDDLRREIRCWRWACAAMVLVFLILVGR